MSEITQLSSDPDVRERQADQMRHEIADSIRMDTARERFLADEAEKRERFGIEQTSDYWQWMFNQYIRHTMGVTDPAEPNGGRFLSGSTRKPGSHGSNRHRR